MTGIASVETVAQSLKPGSSTPGTTGCKVQRQASSQEQLTEDKPAAGPYCGSSQHCKSRMSGHCTAAGRRV